MINATIAARGAPFDFDRWAAMGCAGWAWADVAPLFNAIETDLDFGDQPDHGNAGPIVIQRYKPASWAPVNRVMYEACLELGVREARDLNAADGQAGVIGADAAQPLQGSAPGHAGHLSARRPASAEPDDPRRLPGRSGAACPARRRPASRTWTAKAAAGTAHADEIVLSAGVYNSPAILQRSGIGPAEWLRPLGIPVAADLPVGQ